MKSRSSSNHLEGKETMKSLTHSLHLLLIGNLRLVTGNLFMRQCTSKIVLLPVFVLLAFANSLLAGSAFLQIHNGYFWDPAAGDYFVPRGVAYQIWNPPVGANQSLSQIDYDLLEFKKLHANSVRAELAWGQVEISPGQYDWSKPDHLVQKAEELGIRLFVIIGYQYPPAWFPTNCLGINNLGLRADVIQCLSNSTPENALSCLPPSMASSLQTANSPTVLTQLMTCLVQGAKAGGVPGVLARLQSTLTQSQLASNLPYLISDVINYEDPAARAAYLSYIAAVAARYQNSSAIGAWILGNEYAYFDLWEDRSLYSAHRFLGYDSISQQSFRGYLKSVYQDNIAELNTNWQSAFPNFDAVVMPLDYPADRHLPGFHDLIQWRKQSIANFVSLGALAAKQADPNHLRTYSMVGGLFNGADANYTCEDARAIVSACGAAGAPLDFWSINNYAWTWIGSEMRSVAFGIQKYQAESGLPVMVSETGHSSTEDLFDYDSRIGVSYAGARQPKALPSSIWESLLSGAIGVHLFTWNDRSLFTTNYFYRERGFGIVEESRKLKHPVYDNVAAMFRQMQNMQLDKLLGGSANPPPDILFFWSTNADMVWPRANQEDAMIWGALKRLGFQPGIIDDAAFEKGAYSNAPALLLSRCYQMDPANLRRLSTEVLPAGIHIHAEADLPGQFDAYCRPNANWSALIRDIFGVDVSQASPGFDLIVTKDCYSPIHLLGVAPLGSIGPGYAVDLTTWKFWRNVNPTSSKTILTGFGFSPASSSQPNCPYVDMTPYPALLINASGNGLGKTALNPFALGDSGKWSGTEAGSWDTRYAILRAIYRDHFGLQPVIDLSGPGATHVLSSYRICANGSTLIALLNEDTNAAVLTISAPSLLQDCTIEDLSLGGVLARNSSGSITYTNKGDECVVLYAYKSNGQHDDSLVNASPNKVWFEAAPLAAWPAGSAASVTIGYDVRDADLTLGVTLEQVSQRQIVFGRSAVTNVVGRGTLVVPVPLPDADANNPYYISSHQGAQYVFHASLARASSPVSDVSLPVRLLFGVYPVRPLPSGLLPGHTYEVGLGWEELPSFLSPDHTPLDRAAIWDSQDVDKERYRVVLELSSGSNVAVSNSIVTSDGTGSHTFAVTVPSDSSGPFTWNAYLQTAPNVLSHDVNESFEGFTRGAKWQGPDLPFLTNVYFLAPWTSYVYGYPTGSGLWLNDGVQRTGSDGCQSGFIVVTNPPGQLYSGFGMYYEFAEGDWALPTDRQQWANYVFSYDYMDTHGNQATVDMQIKDAAGNWIQWTAPYNQPAGSWLGVRASLDQFQPPPPGVCGPFNPLQVHSIVLNIEMLSPAGLYVGSFDNIQFDGPEIDLGGGETTATYTSANDSLGWLSIDRAASGLSISWIGGGTLQSAPDLVGPWTNLVNASNPFPAKPAAARQFFRLRQ
jgi:hypothetical protein